MKKEEVKDEAKEAGAEQKQNQTVLLGTVSYTDEAKYEEFLQTMDINKAIFVLAAASNFAQSKGAYSVAEAELISCANRAIRKATTPKEEESPIEVSVDENTND